MPAESPECTRFIYDTNNSNICNPLGDVLNSMKHDTRLGHKCRGKELSQFSHIGTFNNRANMIPPPPLAQARPRSQKSGENGGSTPTPCLDKAVHVRDTCDSQTGNNIASHG